MTPEERSNLARLAGLQAAAKMTPEQRSERARKAGQESAKLRRERRERNEEAAEQLRAQWTADGVSEAVIAAELERLGLGPRKRRPTKSVPAPTRDEWEPYLPQVDAQFDGLTEEQRRRQAIAFLRADRARHLGGWS